MVFHRPGMRRFHEPQLITDIECLTTYKLLGIHLSSMFSMENYFDHITLVTSQQLIILSLLKKQGLSVAAPLNSFSRLNNISSNVCSAICHCFKTICTLGIIDSMYLMENLIGTSGSKCFKLITINAYIICCLIKLQMVVTWESVGIIYSYPHVSLYCLKKLFS